MAYNLEKLVPLIIIVGVVGLVVGKCKGFFGGEKAAESPATIEAPAEPGVTKQE
ncbi:hypothetical protein FACS189461_4650 [Spirochaetia bacterium]|nr:hypothetical protein FACS189461_4650 [Spirochaetia bacterium]